MDRLQWYRGIWNYARSSWAALRRLVGQRAEYQYGHVFEKSACALAGYYDWAISPGVQAVMSTLTPVDQAACGRCNLPLTDELTYRWGEHIAL